MTVCKQYYHSEVLRRYAGCKLGSEVIAVQDSWIKQCQSERQSERDQLDLPPTSSSDDSENNNIDDAAV